MIVRTSLVDLRKVIPITIMYQLSILIVRIFLNFYIDNSSTVNIKHQKVRKKEEKKKKKKKDGSRRGTFDKIRDIFTDKFFIESWLNT